MKRISIIGPPGSGKSTIARQLGDLFDLPVYHLDQMFWKPGWVESERDEFHERVLAVTAQERWVIDGNSSATLDKRMERSDLIVFLDLPRRTSIFRVLKRWRQYAGQTRPDMGEGCNEKVDLDFLRWTWNFPKHSRPGLIEYVDRWEPYREVHWLREPDEVHHFLRAMRVRRLRSGIASTERAGKSTPAARRRRQSPPLRRIP